MSKEKAIRTAKKLKALVDKGIGGESHNAKRKLDSLLRKYNLSASEVFGTDVEYVWENMTTLNESNAILNRVILSIRPDAKIEIERKGVRLTIKVMLTEKEYKQIKRKHKHFWNEYNKDRALFLSAFFNVNSHYFIPRTKVDKKFYDAGAVVKPPPKDNPEAQGKVENMSTEEQQRVGMYMKAMRRIYYSLDDDEINDFKMIGRNNKRDERRE